MSSPVEGPRICSLSATGHQPVIESDADGREIERHRCGVRQGHFAPLKPGLPVELHSIRGAQVERGWVLEALTRKMLTQVVCE